MAAKAIPVLEMIETARRVHRITMSALAADAGIERNKLAAVLGGLTPEECERLVDAAKNLGLL